MSESPPDSHREHQGPHRGSIPSKRLFLPWLETQQSERRLPCGSTTSLLQSGLNGLDSAQHLPATREDCFPEGAAFLADQQTRRLMRFGYTIIHGSAVAASLSFFESAFGLQRRFLHESGDCGEMETGEITLAFASWEPGSKNFPDGFVATKESSKPRGIDIALVTPSVAMAHAKALAAGAAALKQPEAKPWGQIVS